MKTELSRLLDCWADFDDLNKAAQVLEWDQETKMPSTGGPARSNQLATLAKVAHERLVSPDFRRALKDVARSNGMSVKDTAIVREAKREHDRAAKVPSSLVEEVARAESVGLEAWRKAYRTDRWREFAKELANLVRLKRRVADTVGYANEPYDALLDIYEPGATVAELDPLLGGLRDATIPLVQRIAKAKRRPNRSIVTKKYPEAGQLEFTRIVVAAMGFDFDGGRIDLSTHPFCSGFSPGDVRLTTRVNERDLRGCLFGSIHEAGHGLYEQGISRKLERTPLGHAISLGIHESQSRMWENIVGRSVPFWKHFLPKLKKVFLAQLKGVKLHDFVFAVNEVTPSFIRVEADEVTYNLHIVMRYELEKALISGRLKPADLPEAWNAQMKKLLGIVPKKNAEGVLQDIHWAMGLFGYFPTYSLGNLYSAQIWKRARKDIPDVDARIAQGDLVTLREWLRKKIHAPGRTYEAKDLIKRATGRAPTPKDFVEYVENKYGELYGL